MEEKALIKFLDEFHSLEDEVNDLIKKKSELTTILCYERYCDCEEKDKCPLELLENKIRALKERLKNLKI